MNAKSLLRFIKDKERLFNEHTTAKDKWLILNESLPFSDMPSAPLILDAGGGSVTAEIINNLFPTCTLFTANINLQNTMNMIKCDIERDDLQQMLDKSFDMIFLMDVIEHLYDPDKAIVNLLNVLKNKGYLIISTPNLADIYNRIFLLFGYSLHNYNVSQWYKTGNPFIKDLSGKRHGNHKSIFTVKQLIELLGQVHKLEMVYSKGYSYYEADWLDYYDKSTRAALKMNARLYSHNALRTLLNKLLPDSLREGILLIMRKHD
ncbi:MAG: class I SAM-dependent methyltransferase [Nitrospirae bacterium]|nr:class I SAM-dependent methyltransferase [Nitrospirota bacterium]